MYIELTLHGFHFKSILRSWKSEAVMGKFIAPRVPNAYAGQPVGLERIDYVHVQMRPKMTLDEYDPSKYLTTSVSSIPRFSAVLIGTLRVTMGVALLASCFSMKRSLRKKPGMDK